MSERCNLKMGDRGGGAEPSKLPVDVDEKKAVIGLLGEVGIAMRLFLGDTLLVGVPG